jgi:hypothetical protein
LLILVVNGEERIMDNMNLWDKVKVTDPAAVKRITGKPYQGHSPKPYWLIQRATEVFGPCGLGWGIEVKSEGFHRMTDTDVMHTAVVVLWYIQDGKRGVIEHMGQTKACYAKSGGGMMLDEDAGKKSVTDGMVKCLSMLGFAGDIFSGQWDDSKYVEWAKEETERREAPEMSQEQVNEIESLASQAGVDFNVFLGWVSKIAGKNCTALNQAPASAYALIMRQLKKRVNK